MNINTEDFLLIKESALPDIFRKVLTATQMIQNGDAASTSEAVKMVGISRSVYYKYRDAVYSYARSQPDTLLTVQFTLHDRPGVLVNLLSYFCDSAANILTVNQNMPVQGKAFVSITARLNRIDVSPETFLQGLEEVNGVIKIESIRE